jgi:hypothetical protein
MSKRKLPPSQRPERQPDDKRRKPRNLNERLAWTTGLLVHWGLKDGKPPAAIRLHVHKVLEQAFDHDGIELRTIETDGQPEDCVSTPGLFMMCFDNEFDQVNYRDPYNQERISAVVDKAIDYQGQRALIGNLGNL